MEGPKETELSALSLFAAAVHGRGAQQKGGGQGDPPQGEKPLEGVEAGLHVGGCQRAQRAHKVRGIVEIDAGNGIVDDRCAHKNQRGPVTEISTMETSVSMVEPLHTATNTVKGNTAAVMTRSCVGMENSRVKTSGASTRSRLPRFLQQDGQQQRRVEAEVAREEPAVKQGRPADGHGVEQVHLPLSVQEAEIGQGKDQGKEDHGGNAQDGGGRPGGDDHVVHRDFIELGLRHPLIVIVVSAGKGEQQKDRIGQQQDGGIDGRDAGGTPQLPAEHAQNLPAGTNRRCC